jgi:hypothetical protein
MHVCSHREQFSDWKDGEERPSALLARRAEEGMEPDDLLCSRNARPYLQKVTVEAQVEQRSIRLGVFSTLNLDLSLDLPMGRAQLGIHQASPSRSSRLSRASRVKVATGSAGVPA